MPTIRRRKLIRATWVVVFLSFPSNAVTAPPEAHLELPGVVRDPNNKDWYSHCKNARGATQADAAAIAGSLAQRMQVEKIVLQREQCIQENGNTTMMMLCNKDTKPRDIKWSDLVLLQTNFDRDCAGKEDGNSGVPLGGLRHENGLQWETWGFGDVSEEVHHIGKRAQYMSGARNRVNCNPLKMPMDPSIVYHNCIKPAIQELDRYGDCPLQPGSKNPCMQYCEETRRFLWGREQPFPQTNLAYCPRGASSCGWSDGMTFSVSKGWLAQLSVNTPKIPEGVIAPLAVANPAMSWLLLLNMLSIFNAAYAEIETKSEGISQSGSHGFQGKTDYCGYWTFIPKITETCGTVSVYRAQRKNEYGEVKECRQYKEEPPITYKKRCAFKPITGEDGRPIGESIIVWYDCDSKKRAPDIEQNPLYLTSGVALSEAQIGNH